MKVKVKTEKLSESVTLNSLTFQSQEWNLKKLQLPEEIESIYVLQVGIFLGYIGYAGKCITSNDFYK